jgi:solute carrier family 5 (sodium-coupled monocarboxylate transporter), member 8/12
MSSLLSILKTFYLQGGLRAVVWTDTLQIILMFLSVLIVVTLGTVYAGGITTVWDTCSKGERLEIFKLA